MSRVPLILRFVWNHVLRIVSLVGIVIVAGVLAAALVGVVGLLLGWWDWKTLIGWRALVAYIDPEEPTHRKDALQVYALIVAGAVAAITATVGLVNLYFTRANLIQQRDQEESRAREQRDQEESRAQSSALQAYYEQMGKLLTEHGLGTTERENLRLLARAQTLTILESLDPPRKSRLLTFLIGSALVQKNDQRERPIIDLGGAALRGADLSGTPLNGADLSHADLREANLSKADLREANLDWANLTRANLSGAYLGYDALVQAAPAHLLFADLREADLQGADLRQAELSSSDLREANLQGAALMRASLAAAKLMRADLSGADLSEGSLSHADLREANLHGAVLTGVTLNGADLSGADLREANLSHAKLLGEADLRHGGVLPGAKLNGADLSRADLTQAAVTKEQLNTAWRLAGATMPDGSKHD